jgi:hypothetical protein
MDPKPNPQSHVPLTCLKKILILILPLTIEGPSKVWNVPLADCNYHMPTITGVGVPSYAERVNVVLGIYKHYPGSISSLKQESTAV